MDRPCTNLWNISADLVPLLGSHRNKVFRTTGLKQEVVFKTTRRSPAAIAWLEAVHRCARHAGFVVPRLFRSRNGKLVENGWTCEGFLVGDNIKPEELPNIRPQLLLFHPDYSLAVA